MYPMRTVMEIRNMGIGTIANVAEAGATKKKAS
jgi:hypothetical protein